MATKPRNTQFETKKPSLNDLIELFLLQIQSPDATASIMQHTQTLINSSQMKKYSPEELQLFILQKLNQAPHISSASLKTAIEIIKRLTPDSAVEKYQNLKEEVLTKQTNPEGDEAAASSSKEKHPTYGSFFQNTSNLSKTMTKIEEIDKSHLNKKTLEDDAPASILPKKT